MSDVIKPLWIRFLVRRALVVVAAGFFVAASSRVAGAQPSVCGDLDDSGAITAADALRLLQRAVGQDVPVQCPGTSASTTTSLGGPTTTSLGGPTTTVTGPSTTVGGFTTITGGPNTTTTITLPGFTTTTVP